MIHRLLTKKLSRYMQTFPSVAILGPRQVGKTTLAKHAATLLNKTVVHVDLEKPSDLVPLEKNPELFFEQNKDACMVIDEVQRMPSLFPLLRPMIDAHRVAGRFLLLGSASPTLLKESSESLAGRIIYTELTPFNLLEIPSDKADNDLWLHGGFPEPFLLPDPLQKSDWYDSFTRTYFERDLKLLGLNLTTELLTKAFFMIAHMQSAPSNIANLSNALDIDRRTVDRILQFFISSYMVRRLPPFYINTKKRLVKSPKYYIRDSGLFHHILGIHTFNDLLRNPRIGASWEGFVIEQVASLATDMTPYFYRTQAGAECDLVLSKGHKPLIAVEAKMTNTPKVTKSLMASLQELRTQDNYIVIPTCDHPYLIHEKVTVCDLRWLLQHLRTSSPST